MSRPRRRASPIPANGRLWWIGLVVLLVGTAVTMFWLTRGLTFNLDEWTVVTQRRGPGAPSLLEPHNEHLTLLFFAIFLPLLKIGGLDAFALHDGSARRAAARAGLAAVRHRAPPRRRRRRARRRGVRAAVGLRLRELPHPRPGGADALDRRRRGGVRAARPAAHAAHRPRARGAHGRRARRVGPRDPGPAGHRGRARADEGGPRAAVGRRRAVRPVPRSGTSPTARTAPPSRSSRSARCGPGRPPTTRPARSSASARSSPASRC